MENLKSLNLKQLRAKCKILGIISSGNKSDVLERLKNFNINSLRQKDAIEEELFSSGKDGGERDSQFNSDEIVVINEEKVTKNDDDAVCAEGSSRRHNGQVLEQKSKDHSNSVKSDELEKQVLELKLKLLEKENILLERENELLKKENEVNTKCKNSDGNNAFLFQYYAKLISDFDGNNVLFNMFIEQVLRIKHEFGIKDEILKLLLVSKLKDKALCWYNSRPEHINMNIDALISAMALVFENRESRIDLKKKFESRIWQKGESFTDYFQDKLNMANQLSLQEAELIDYLIDGIPNFMLKTQAKIQMYRKVEDLVAAMSQVNLPSERQPKMEVNTNKMKKFYHEKKSTDVFCFNCGQKGHMSSKCVKARRQWGSCFCCGEMGHKSDNCPTKVTKKSLTNNMNVIQYFPEYICEVKMSKNEFENLEKEIVIDALVDSGSPISIIKKKYVNNLNIKKINHDINLVGINKSPLDILGEIEGIFVVNNIKVNLKLFVINDDAIVRPCLLGRDFINHENLNITFCKNGNIILKEIKDKIILNNMQEEILEIMNINIEDNKCESNVSDKLNINKNLNFDTKNKILMLYEQYIDELASVRDVESSFEINISLKNDQAFYFKPRRLSFFEKNEVRRIVNDWLQKGIIRHSNSAYSSPIVLVKKKTGDIRLCIDYRCLNNITIKDHYPLPLIEDQIDTLSNKKYFTLV